MGPSTAATASGWVRTTLMRTESPAARPHARQTQLSNHRAGPGQHQQRHHLVSGWHLRPRVTVTAMCPWGGLSLMGLPPSVSPRLAPIPGDGPSVLQRVIAPVVSEGVWGACYALHSFYLSSLLIHSLLGLMGKGLRKLNSLHHGTLIQHP